MMTLSAKQGNLPKRLPLPARRPLLDRLPDPERAEGRIEPTPSPVSKVRVYRRPEQAGGAGGEPQGSKSGVLEALRPWWWLWLIPLLLVLLVLVFLISSENDEPQDDDEPPAPTRVAEMTVSRVGLGGVGLPELGAGNAPPPPLALVVLAGRRPWAEREKEALLNWVESWQAPASRTRVVRPARSADVVGASRWLASPRFAAHKKLVVSLGAPIPAQLAGPRVKRARIRARIDAPVPSMSMADPRRRGAFAGAGALNVARTLGLNVTREPELLEAGEVGR